MFRLLACTLALTALTSCSNLETQEETDALGFRSVWTVDPETGQRQGTRKEYRPDGSLNIEENYVDDQLDGRRTIYFEDGKPNIVENYTNGAFEGDYTVYFQDGKVEQFGRFTNGARNKAWTYYYPDGKIKEVVTFENNVETGPFREWYPDGKPKASGNYREGDKEDGTLHLYAETGELERVMNCDLGRCNSIWTPDSAGVAPAGPDMTPPAK